MLTRLGLIVGRRLTLTGEQVRRLPVHPRLGRMLVESRGARDIVRACALLSERQLLPPRTATTSSDMLSALDRWRDLPPHVHRAAEQLQSEIRDQSAIRDPHSAMASETAFLRSVLAAYPDRVAQCREPGSRKEKGGRGGMNPLLTSFFSRGGIVSIL